MWLLEHAELRAEIDEPAQGPTQVGRAAVNLDRTRNAEDDRLAAPVVEAQPRARRATEERRHHFGAQPAMRRHARPGLDRHVVPGVISRAQPASTDWDCASISPREQPAQVSRVQRRARRHFTRDHGVQRRACRRQAIPTASRSSSRSGVRSSCADQCDRRSTA